MSRDYTPFTSKTVNTATPMRVLHRFTKAGGHVAEIRERVVTPFKALEWLVFIDGSHGEPDVSRRAARSLPDGARD